MQADICIHLYIHVPYVCMCVHFSIDHVLCVCVYRMSQGGLWEGHHFSLSCVNPGATLKSWLLRKTLTPLTPVPYNSYHWYIKLYILYLANYVYKDLAHCPHANYEKNAMIEHCSIPNYYYGIYIILIIYIND